MKLSVITINLNDKKGLLQTIESLANQNFVDYEFLIIDGGSTDGSLDVIEEYKDRISYWISESDKGIYNAMNKGIVKAKGEYCYFLNSGDRLVSDSVFTDMFADEPDESFLCGNFYYEEKGTLTKQDEYRGRDWTFSLYDIYSGFLCHQAFFIKKEMFEKYGLYDEKYKILSDWKLFLEAVGLHHESIKYIDTDIVIYNLEGLSSTIGGKAIYEEKRLIAKELFSSDLFSKVDKLYYLDRNDFWVDFIHSKKWIHFIMKAFLKICIMLRVTKI